jgi:hypothetical protein
VIEGQLHKLVAKYAADLNKAIEGRVEEMRSDDVSHFLVYRGLGIAEEEGRLIDVYQNKGRFLYKYAGSFMEEAVKLCFSFAFPESRSLRIPHGISTFEIDCLVGQEALEIKWRDASTDGDHTNKERTRLRAIVAAGYKPIRVMFYYPNREQAKRIQKNLERVYIELGGEYYVGERAWDYVQARTGVPLKQILQEAATRRLS